MATIQQQLQAAKEKRAAAYDKVNGYAAKIEARSWSDTDDGPGLDAAQSDFEDAHKEVERLEGLANVQARAAAWQGGGGAGDRGAGAPGAGNPRSPVSVNVITDPKKDDKATARRNYSLMRAVKAAATGRMEGLEAEMHSEGLKQMEEAGLGSQISERGIMVPSWMNPALDKEYLLDRFGEQIEKRDLTYGTAATAGNLVQTELKGMIPILQPKLFSRELGATFFPGLQGDVDFPRQTTDAVATWAATENASATETDPNVDKVQLRAKRVTATVDLSRKLMVQSSIGVENWIRRRFNYAAKKLLDQGIISGSGASGQILGLLNRAINDITLGANGAALTWANVVDFETQVAIDDADFENMAYLTNPNVFGKLKTTEKAATTGMFIANGAINRNSGINDYRAYLTNLIPNNLSKGASGAVLSAMLFGNWSELYIGQWGGVELIVNPYTKSKEDLTEVTLHSFWDIAVAHEASFCKCDEIVTT